MDEELREHTNAVRSAFVEYLYELIIVLSLFCAIVSLGGTNTITRVAGLATMLVFFALAARAWHVGRLSWVLRALEKKEDVLAEKSLAEHRRKFNK